MLPDPEAAGCNAAPVGDAIGNDDTLLEAVGATETEAEAAAGS